MFFFSIQFVIEIIHDYEIKKKNAKIEEPI